MDDPLHPYTAYLLNAIPKKDMHYRRTHLQVKEISPAVKGCPYQSICEKVKKRCTEELPPLEVVGMRKVRCFYP